MTQMIKIFAENQISDNLLNQCHQRSIFIHFPILTK